MNLQEWTDYENGIAYNQSLTIDGKGYYEQIDANIAFASGDQWRNVKAQDIVKPIVPIIQKAKQHTIANLCSTNISATINPLEYSSKEENRTPEMEQEIEATEIANAEIRNILDEIKYEFKVREILSDSYDAGDSALHFYWDADKEVLKGKDYKGKLCAEIVDGQNVMLGNANNRNIEEQPYVIVVGRDLTSNLKAEANKNTNVDSDFDYGYQASDFGKLELNSDKFGKSLYIYHYHRDNKTGEILVSKCVKGGYIYKDRKTGLKKYPVAWFNYLKQKNTYHGKAAVTGLIPNQIAVNKLLAMIIYSVMHTAFPTMIYDASRISSPSNQIGQAIPVKLNPGETLRDVATYLEIGQVSPQVIQVIDLIMSYTKDMLGINDAAVGNVTPDNAQAIALAEKLTSVPLENVRSNLYEFTESIVDIILDFIGSKYGVRPVVVKNGEDTSIVTYDFDAIKELNYAKRVDVGAIGYASELSSLKELKDLLNIGAITVVDYLKRLPEYTVPERDELVKELEARLGMISSEEQREKEMTYEQMMAFMETLPEELQAELRQLPDDKLEQAVMELMQTYPQQQQEAQLQGQEQEINQMLLGGQQ